VPPAARLAVLTDTFDRPLLGRDPMSQDRAASPLVRRGMPITWWSASTITLLNPCVHHLRQPLSAPARRRTVRDMPRLLASTWLLPAVAVLSLATPAHADSLTLRPARRRARPLRSNADHDHQWAGPRCGEATRAGPAGRWFADLRVQRCCRERRDRNPDCPTWQRCCHSASHQRTRVSGSSGPLATRQR
jgi:hypothetical protein